MKHFDDLVNGINSRLSALLEHKSGEYTAVADAMKYSAEIGGKRLRPAILLEFYEICGGSAAGATDVACALEMIHTYSLIHDDLPCMDNDDMRRGKPACHIAFGETNALLAGDGLLTYAFETAASAEGIEPSALIKAIGVLAQRAGTRGMIGGQEIDLGIEGKDASLETVLAMYKMKTGALISAAAEIGCILAGADETKVGAASEFAYCLGLAFQIQDDILDATGSAEVLGKPIGSDAENHKSTYLSHMGAEFSKQKVRELTEKAKSALAPFGEKADELCRLADSLIDRKY